MDEKMKAYNEMSKLEYELDDKVSQLEQAKDKYKDELVKQTIGDIMTVLKDEGTLSERDLKLFLRDLVNDVKKLYAR